VLAVLASIPLTAMLSSALTRKIHHDHFSRRFPNNPLIHLILFSLVVAAPRPGMPEEADLSLPERRLRQLLAACDQRISNRLPVAGKARFLKDMDNARKPALACTRTTGTHPGAGARGLLRLS